jgi:uncharacterized protein (DUF1330 family)
MPAYVLFIRESAIRDQSEMDLYRRLGREVPPDPKLKPLVVYGAMEALEGELPDGVVVLEFPTLDDAKAWYHSPGYQAILQHRRKGAEYRGFIVQGFG